MCSLVENGRFTGEMRVCQGANFFFFLIPRCSAASGPGPGWAHAQRPWCVFRMGSVGGVWILGEDLVGSNGGFRGSVSSKEEKS